jgi:hypothetical protein
MKKQSSGRSQAGGGINSRVNVSVPVRTGTPARGISPGAASQIGSAIGNKVTEEVGGKIAYRGENYLVGKTPAGGAVPLGNQLATRVGKGAPGADRTVHACGSQQGVSPVRSPNASGVDILRQYGPDVSGRRGR